LVLSSQFVFMFEGDPVAGLSNAEQELAGTLRPEARSPKPEARSSNFELRTEPERELRSENVEA
jgi:hypothetical protein